MTTQPSPLGRGWTGAALLPAALGRVRGLFLSLAQFNGRRASSQWYRTGGRVEGPGLRAVMDFLRPFRTARQHLAAHQDQLRVDEVHHDAQRPCQALEHRLHEVSGVRVTRFPGLPYACNRGTRGAPGDLVALDTRGDARTRFFQKGFVNGGPAAVGL